MEKRLTLAFWAILVGIAAWQSPGWWEEATDPRVDAGPVPQVQPSAALGPRKPALKRRDPNMPYKIDLRDAKQVEKFVRSPFDAEKAGRMTRNENGNSGPFDTDGNLIMPLDTRNMH